MKNINITKFYKTMDQLMSEFSPPRVSTSFERKVGASLCKASELAMSDQLPKFRLVLCTYRRSQDHLKYRFVGYVG